jgi:hypothetical protein
MRQTARSTCLWRAMIMMTNWRPCCTATQAAAATGAGAAGGGRGLELKLVWQAAAIAGPVPTAATAVMQLCVPVQQPQQQ